MSIAVTILIFVIIGAIAFYCFRNVISDIRTSEGCRGCNGVCLQNGGHCVRNKSSKLVMKHLERLAKKGEVPDSRLYIEAVKAAKADIEKNGSRDFFEGRANKYVASVLHVIGMGIMMATMAVIAVCIVMLLLKTHKDLASMALAIAAFIQWGGFAIVKLGKKFKPVADSAELR